MYIGLTRKEKKMNSTIDLKYQDMYITVEYDEADGYVDLLTIEGIDVEYFTDSFLDGLEVDVISTLKDMRYDDYIESKMMAEMEMRGC